MHHAICVKARQLQFWQNVQAQDACQARLDSPQRPTPPNQAVCTSPSDEHSPSPAGRRSATAAVSPAPAAAQVSAAAPASDRQSRRTMLPQLRSSLARDSLDANPVTLARPDAATSTGTPTPPPALQGGTKGKSHASRPRGPMPLQCTAPVEDTHTFAVRAKTDPFSARLHTPPGLYDANALDRLHRPDSQHAAAMPTGVSRPASGASHMSTGFFAGDPPGLGLPFHPDSHPQEAGLQGWEGPRVRYAPSSQQRPSQQASAPAQLRAVSHGAQPAPRHMAAQLLVRSTGQPIPSATGNGFSGLQAPPGLDAPGSWPPSPLSTCANEVVSSSSALFPRGIPQHTPSPVPPKEDLRGIAAQLAPGAPENGYAGLDPPPGLDPLAESAGQSARISSNSIPAHKGTPGTPSGPDIASPMTPGTLKRAWPPTGEVGAAQPSQTDSGVLSSRKRSRAQRILQLSAAEAVSPMPPLHSLRDQQRASPAGNASLLLQGAKLHVRPQAQRILPVLPAETAASPAVLPSPQKHQRRASPIKSKLPQGARPGAPDPPVLPSPGRLARSPGHQNLPSQAQPAKRCNSLRKDIINLDSDKVGTLQCCPAQGLCFISLSHAYQCALCPVPKGS